MAHRAYKRFSNGFEVGISNMEDITRCREDMNLMYGLVQ